MKYMILVTIKSELYPYLIEMAKEIDLPFHPNKDDIIDIDELSCSINEIRFDFDSNLFWLKAFVIDDYLEISTETKEKLLKSLSNLAKELLDYDWYVNDYDLDDIKLTTKSYNKDV